MKLEQQVTDEPWVAGQTNDTSGINLVTLAGGKLNVTPVKAWRIWRDENGLAVTPITEFGIVTDFSVIQTKDGEYFASIRRATPLSL
jgi:hypothetical protein